MYKPKVFLSGGFKSNWQQQVISACEKQFTFFNPRLHGLSEEELYTVWDIHHVKHADIIFAYLEKDNPSGLGLIFEIGLAVGLNKTIILVDEKSESDVVFGKYFKIVRHSSSNVFSTLANAISYLKSFGISS